MKKIVALLLVFVMVLALAACGQPKVDPNAKSEGVMTYAEYAAAEVDAEVVIEAYLQAKQAYNAEYGNTSLFLADGEGAYFVYRLPCTQEEYDAMVVGQKLKIEGFKGDFSGEAEIVDVKSFEVEDGTWTAEAVDLTAEFGGENLVNFMNQRFTVKDAVVADSDGAAFLYGWDGSGEDGSDLYFKLTIGENTYTFVVESDEFAAGTELYEAVKALNVGDTVDLEGFLYWYEGPQPHTTAVTVK